MTNEIQYEEVPQDDLRDDQLYVINAAKSIPSSEVGATAVAAKGLYDIGKTIPSAAKYIPQIISEMVKNRAATPEVTIGPITTESGAAVPKVGGRKWNETLTGNSATGSQMDKASLLKNQEMMKTIGPGGELAGGEIHGGNVLTGPEMKASPKLANVGIPELAHLPAGSPEYFEALDKYIKGEPIEPPKVVPLTPAQRAMQVAQGIGKFAEPAYKGIDYLNTQINKIPGANNALKYLGIYGTFNQGSEAIKHGMHGNYGRAALDALGGAGDLAAMYAPHPGARLAGLGVGLAAPYISKKLDEKYGRNYATGGLVYIGK